MHWLLLVVALAAGAGMPIQASINAAMRAHVGRAEWAAIVNFAVGLVALLAWVLVVRAAWPSASALARAPWWAWMGGFIGAFYVSATVLLTPRLGVAVTFALGIAGQMACALVLDHLGLIGLAVRPVTAGRLLGAALLVAGVVLIRR